MSFNRLVALASLAVAALAAAVVPMLAIASSSAPVKGGHYSGTVGPGYPISFRVSARGTSVTDLVVAFEETCNGAAGNTAPQFHFKTLGIRRGTFSGSSTDRFGKTVSDALRISGSFAGRKVTGKVADVSKIKSLHTCTQTEPFTAQLK
jgi:hypothetical protein